jgi:hypothetical protein
MPDPPVQSNPDETTTEGPNTEEDLERREREFNVPEENTPLETDPPQPAPGVS